MLKTIGKNMVTNCRIGRNTDIEMLSVLLKLLVEVLLLILIEMLSLLVDISLMVETLLMEILLLW